jgi:hypothetical protein
MPAVARIFRGAHPVVHVTQQDRGGRTAVCGSVLSGGVNQHLMVRSQDIERIPKCSIQGMSREWERIVISRAMLPN